MPDVNITDLRQNLPAYVDQARRGKEIRITVRGKVVARIVPDKDEQEAARLRLDSLRSSSRVGDVLSPSGASWEAERDRR
jgi:prevent-host-death family protein